MSLSATDRTWVSVVTPIFRSEVGKTEVGEPELGAVRRHLRVIPAGESQAGTGGIGSREGEKVPPARHHCSRTGGVGGQGDEFVDDLAVGPVPLPYADQPAAAQGAQVRVPDRGW